MKDLESCLPFVILSNEGLTLVIQSLSTRLINQSFDIYHSERARFLLETMHGIAIYAIMFLFSGKNVIVYTCFKKRCRRERRMAVVERKLHDRKELWFPYLVCKNNRFFAWR